MKRADVLPLRRAVAMARYLAGGGRHQDAALVALCAGFGLRIGDALNLTWNDLLDGPREFRTLVTVHERKNKRTRVVSLLPWVQEILGSYLDQLGHPAPQDRVVPYTRYRGWQVIKEAAKALGYTGRITPHSLRKAFCDAVYEQTRDPVATSRITGHSNPSQLLAYIGRRPEVEDQVWRRLAALKL